jgi:iron complex outermembrane receptor protein
MLRTRRLQNCVSLLALATGVLAFAETATAQVETVVVTAERRNVDLQKTTLAATVLSGDDLSKKSVGGLTALQYAAPGIQISDYGSANVFNMRGVGREAVDVEIPSGVAIYRDGVPTLAGYFQNEPYYDLDGIEVLRGPQGTLAGQSASGGAVFIRSKNPDLNGPSGYFQAGFGNWDETEFQGAGNVPLSDDLALRVSVNHTDRSSMYKLNGLYSGHPGDHDVNDARIGLFWQPDARWEILLKTDLGRLDYGGNPVSTPGMPLFKITLNDPMEYLDKSIRQVVDIKYHFDGGITLHSLTGLQDVSTVNNLDADGGGPAPILGIPAPLQNSFKSQGNFFFYSQEFDLVSPDDQRFRWVVGLFGERQVSHIPDYLTTGEDGFTFTGFGTGDPKTGIATAPFFTTPWQEYQNDLAVFANTEYDLQPDLTLEAGLRASYNDRQQFTEFTVGDGVSPPTGLFDPMGGARARDSGDYLDGKLALQWKPTQNDFLYVEGSRGHTVKGINIFPPHDQYAPVEVWDYEAGWKSTLFDNHLRTQLDAYYEDIGNYQAVFGFAIPGSAVPAASETRNAESRSKIWGIEASGQANWDAFSLDFGAAYLNSKIGTFSNVANQFSVVPVPVKAVPPTAVLGNPVAAAEAAAFGKNCSVNDPLLTLTGAKAPFSPDITANAGAQYRISTGTDWAVTPRADVAYTGTQQADLFNCSLETIKARTLVNLQMRIDSDDSPWWASVWVTNLADLKYVAAVQNIPPILYAGPRREFGIRFGRTF